MARNGFCTMLGVGARFTLQSNISNCSFTNWQNLFSIIPVSFLVLYIRLVQHRGGRSISTWWNCWVFKFWIYSPFQGELVGWRVASHWNPLSSTDSCSRIMLDVNISIYYGKNHAFRSRLILWEKPSRSETDYFLLQTAFDPPTPPLKQPQKLTHFAMRWLLYWWHIGQPLRTLTVTGTQMSFGTWLLLKWYEVIIHHHTLAENSHRTIFFPNRGFVFSPHEMGPK